MTGLVGTGALVRLALRRDRIMLPAWIAVFVGMSASSASATAALYPTPESRVLAAGSINDTPSLVALYGRIYDPTSLGSVAMLKLTGFGAVMISVLAMIIVVRHTRAEEEAGRLELLGAAVVGRYAALSAALIVAVGTNVVLGVLTALGLVAAALPVAGSVAFGLAWAATGIAFAAVAAVAAQLTSSARAATGLTAGVLGVTYVLRAIGDTASAGGPQWASWLSPVGWGQQIWPFAGERWWVAVVPAVFALVVGAGAYALAARRDMGAGLLADRPGRASAAPSLRTPLALAWRLHRTALITWTAAFALLGLVLGNIASGIGKLLDSPQARAMITALGGEKGLTDTFLAAELGFVGVIASVYGVQAVMRLRSEETGLRAEPLLAAGAGRIRWVSSHVVIALVGTSAMVAGAGLTAGLAHAAHTGDSAQIGRVLVAALVHLPAVWVLTGIVVAAFGVAPRLIVAGWVALVLFLLLGEFGPLFKLDQTVMDVSPFAHVPKLPGAVFTATPVVALTAVAAALIAAGLVAFRRRDLG